MAEVFISYASEDRDRAGMLAGALAARGWTIWWDRNIVIGQPFDDAIERELEGAKCVVVLWSSHSIASEWVRTEAAVAAERGVLIPAALDPVKLPLEFRRRQTADLSAWKGESSHDGFQALCEAIGATVSGKRGRQEAPAAIPAARTNRGWLPGAVGALAVAVGVALYAVGMGRPDSAKPAAPVPTAPADNAKAERPVGGAKPEVRVEAKVPARTALDLAELVAGRYVGDVIADAKGSSRTAVVVTIAPLDRAAVRVSSDYARLGTVDIALSRNGNQIFNSGGDTPFIVDLDRNPPTLIFDPRSEVAYRGIMQR